MKRIVAGVFLLIGLGAGTMFAQDSYRRERDVRRDQAKIARDRQELRRALYYGDYAAAEHERRELQREYRDLERDYRELDRERQYYYSDQRRDDDDWDQR
jgi:hypothetical protein